MTDRTALLEEFWRAIHDLWHWQHELGVAHATGVPPKQRVRLDREVARAMRRVEVVDDALHGRKP